MQEIYKIEFFNREKEKEEILQILKSEPRLVNFIYGPINSGKTSLISSITENLSGDFIVFYVNLRGKFISDYRDFVEALFETDIEETHKKASINVFIKEIFKEAGKYSGIPVPENVLNTLFKDDEPKNVFEYITKIVEQAKENKKQPILIIDELQIIGDLEVDGKIIYKLFNFFIRLTKELHLCHVFALSSDSLFIEKVYNEAMLQGRANYVLVGDFDEETTKKFLKKYKFRDEEISKVIENFGGKPGQLITAVLLRNQKTNIEKIIENQLMVRKSEIKNILKTARELGDKVTIKDSDYRVDYRMIINALSKFKENNVVNPEEIDEISKAYLVKKNVLFVDCVKDYVMTQSKLDLIAIREILKEMK